MNDEPSLANKSHEDLNFVKTELVSAWAFLITYVELFDHPDSKRMELLQETAPGFFSLVQSALLDAIFIRLTRLMDPADSSRNGTKPNLSFERLLTDNASHVANMFARVKNDWGSGELQNLKEYRNKVFAHNDFTRVSGTPPQVNVKLEKQDVAKLRQLFSKLWDVLVAAYFEKDEIAVLEPIFESQDMLPAKILKELKWSLYQSSLIDADVESGQFDDANFLNFEFANVGEDKLIRLIAN